jgi:signal transduction histidine kinase
MNHSKAKNVKILINSNDNISLEMIIEDDGIGFDPSQMKKGAGLYNVKERANQIGGSINFTSQSGVGTLTTLTIRNSVNAD